MLALRNLLITIINIIVGLVDLILGLRLIFYLLLANPSTPFVSWIYGLSSYLTAPFSGLLPPLFFGNLPLDTTTLIALIVYSFIAYLITSAINSLTLNTLAGRDQDRIEEEEYVEEYREERPLRRRIRHVS